MADAAKARRSRVARVSVVVCAVAAAVALSVVLGRTVDAPRAIQSSGPVDVEKTRGVATAAAGSCGVELWSLKTLTDPAASAVSLTPVPTTVGQLVRLPAPAANSTRGRDAPAETTTWTVSATLTGYKLEADSDIHLVLSDQGLTMIAEIPDPACAAGSRVQQQIGQTRAAFVARYNPANGCFSCLTQPVTLTGVGFFDFLHGQTGVAANGIELHPLLAVSFASAPPPVTTTVATTTTAPVTTAPVTTTTPTVDADHAEDARECPTFIPASDVDLRDDIHERTTGVCPRRR